MQHRDQTLNAAYIMRNEVEPSWSVHEAQLQLKVPCSMPHLSTASASGCCIAGVAVGAYANGFKTTTTQWLVGKDAPKLPVDDGELRAAVGPCLLPSTNRYCMHVNATWC
jgi:hypothetical protein